MLFLERQTFENYWFSTGTPSFLIKLLRQEQSAAYELQEMRANDDFLDSADVNDNPRLLLAFRKRRRFIIDFTFVGAIDKPHFMTIHPFFDSASFLGKTSYGTSSE